MTCARVRVRVQRITRTQITAEHAQDPELVSQLQRILDP